MGVHSGAGVGSDGQTSLALIASVHEFGAPSVNVPERAPIRITIDREREAYRTLLARIARLYVTRGIPLREMLNRLGLKVSTDIQQTVRDGLSPALAESTKEGRRSRLNSNGGQARNTVFTDTGDGWTPLIDTGRLVNSYTYEVEA